MILYCLHKPDIFLLHVFIKGPWGYVGRGVLSKGVYLAKVRGIRGKAYMPFLAGAAACTVITLAGCKMEFV